MIKIQSYFMVLVFALTSAFGQNAIMLTGKIMTRTGAPIPGAAVKLVKKNMSVTSGADGSYTLASSNVVPVKTTAVHASALVHRNSNGSFGFFLPAPSLVSISITDVSGRKIAAIPQSRLQSGEHTLALPKHHQQAGMWIIDASIDNARFSALLGPNSVRQMLHNGQPVQSPANLHGIAKGAAAAILDTLRVGHPNHDTVSLQVYVLVDSINVILDKTDPYCQSRQQVVHRINYYRSTVKLGHLKRRLDKDSCIDAEAAYDAGKNTAHAAFGRCDENGQNECPGWKSEAQIVTGCTDAMWDEGPGGGHYDNMTRSSFHQVSVGFFMTTDKKLWSIQNFWP